MDQSFAMQADSACIGSLIEMTTADLNGPELTQQFNWKPSSSSELIVNTSKLNVITGRVEQGVISPRSNTDHAAFWHWLFVHLFTSVIFHV